MAPFHKTTLTAKPPTNQGLPPDCVLQDAPRALSYVHLSLSFLEDHYEHAHPDDADGWTIAGGLWPQNRGRRQRRRRQEGHEAAAGRLADAVVRNQRQARAGG